MFSSKKMVVHGVQVDNLDNYSKHHTKAEKQKISAFPLPFQKKPASLQCVTFDTGEIVRQL